MLREKDTRGVWWARIALSVVPTVVILGGVEFVLRHHYSLRQARLWDALPVARAGGVDRDNFRLVDLVQVAPWRDLVYELRPDVQGTFLGAPYRTNEFGMRDGPTTIEKPPDVYRIALLGDSLGFGWRLPIEQGFADLLEGELQGAVGERRVEVLNFCVPGYNTAIEDACLRHRALAFDPDLIVVQYFHNDLYLPNFLLDEPTPPRSYLVDWVRRRLAPPEAGDMTRLVPPRSGDGESNHAVAAWRRDPERVPAEYAYMVGYEGVEAALRRIRATAEARGVEVVFVVTGVPHPRCFVPGSNQPLALPVDEPVRAIARDLGFRVLDLVPPTARRLLADGKTDRDFILSDRDWHPNAYGHGIIAGLIADELRGSRLMAVRR